MWPDSLEYPVEIIEAVATYIHLADAPVPHVVKAGAKEALADVADAAGAVPPFGEARGPELGDDWMPIANPAIDARRRAVMDAAAAKGDTSEMRREYEGKNL